MSPSGAATASDRHRSGLTDAAILVALVLVLVALVRSIAAQPFFIPSASMEPQLKVHDRIVVSRFSYRLHDPRRGDIVVFSEPPAAKVIEGDTTEPGPGNPVSKLIHGIGEAVGLIQPSTQDWVKRVIGLPGDKVEGIGGYVYVNDHLLIEPYLPPGTITQPFPPARVGSGQLWVMGDNRGDSLDSRVFGPIARSSVVGRTFVRIWPLWHASFL